jgi:hypothetical protein
VLLILLVIAVDPSARQKAVALVNRWNEKIVANASSDQDSDEVVTPTPQLTPAATALANNDNDEIIPNTGDDNSKEQPIIQINWTALGDALRKFWDELRNIKIEFRPNTNR